MGRSRPWWLVTLVATAVALVLPYLASDAAWLPLTVALGAGALALTQSVDGGRRLSWLVGVSFAVRAALGVTLFFVSAYDLPLLRPMHLGYGLWTFGADGVAYHEQAVAIRDAWLAQVDLPPVLVNELFPISVAAAGVYVAFGDLPLNFILVNAWLGAVSGLLVYLLAVRVGDRRGALAVAGLVAFWPSSFIWSAQLLKDPAMCAAILASLGVLVALWQRHGLPGLQGRRASGEVLLWTSLAASVFVLTFLRKHAGLLLVASLAPVCAVAAGRSLLRRQWLDAAIAAAIVTVAGGSALAGMSLDMPRLLSTRHPEVGYVELGNTLRDRGDATAAVAAYQRAIALEANYAPAHREMARVVPQPTSPPAPTDPPELRRPPRALHASDVDGARAERLREILAKTQGGGWRRSGASTSTPTLPLHLTAPPPAAAPMSMAFKDRIMAALDWVSFNRLAAFRQTQVNAAGGQLVDSVLFRTPLDFLTYAPRALANAYLAPFPWQLTFTRGHTGFLRPLGLIETVLVGLLLPAIGLAHARRLKQFRVDAWVLMTFGLVMALAYGIMMPNGGSLFRSRLQFLFPMLALGASALPAFVCRWFGPAAGNAAPETAV